MGKKKQEKKVSVLPERKSILDSLKFMQVSKDSVIDKKHKHKHREEEAKEAIVQKKDAKVDESLPFFFKRVQEVAKRQVECIENKVEVNQEVFERINLDKNFERTNY
jgi:hypothetical protein